MAAWKFDGKMNSVKEELDKYKMKVDATRHTGKARELENHEIDLGLYSTSAKICGFAMKNPVVWIWLFEKFYATHKQLKCEWKRIVTFGKDCSFKATKYIFSTMLC